MFNFFKWSYYYIFNITSKIRCKRCSSTDLDVGYYISGWNEELKQADGKQAYFCNDCLKNSNF